ncbi:ABC-2 type transport system ATP-binding protein [Micrococcales bacterium KH10]|nr:ABC-2 type transport system ATP-binding protein [Micrococcales bacterium KH10]
MTEESAATSAVTITGLRVVRGIRTVLSDFNASFPRGRITGLLGPSGSGKTTLLRCVLGVQIVADGKITVLGQAAGSPRLRDRVGYVSQTPSVYSDLTVIENLAYFARVLGIRDRHEAVAQVVEQVDLTDHANHLVANLSGGQRARVSLAAALLGEPELLVLDEPTVGLDPVLRESLWTLFADLARAGRTLIVSSHVMDEAIRCDELVLLRDGELVFSDTPTALLAQTGTTNADEAFLALLQPRAQGEQ